MRLFASMAGAAVGKTLSARGVMMLLRFAGCLRCRGDLVLEVDEWRCLQCGRYYYPQRPLVLEPPGSTGTRRARGVSSSTTAPRMANAPWQSRNDEVIEHFAKGRTVHEIVRLVARNLREGRSVLEPLVEVALD